MAKPKPCIEDGCEEPKRHGVHRCGFHWLLKQPTDVQVAAALWRAEKFAGLPDVEPDQIPAGWRAVKCGCRVVPLWYARHARCKAHANAASHASHLERTYRIWDGGELRPFTEADYQAILKHQGGRCAICRRHPGARRMAVDHDHASGGVRGLLCSDPEFGCNLKVVARFDADPKPAAMAQRLLDYLAGRTPAAAVTKPAPAAEDWLAGW